MTEDETPIYSEPPYLAGLNEVSEVLEGIQIALRNPERFASETVSTLAEEVEVVARRHGVYEPLE